MCGLLAHTGVQVGNTLTLTQLLVHSRTLSHTYTRTHSLTHSLTHARTHPLTHRQILADPEAADAVLTSGANITVVGLNVTSHVTLQGQGLKVESTVTLSMPCGMVLVLWCLCPKLESPTTLTLLASSNC